MAETTPETPETCLLRAAQIAAMPGLDKVHFLNPAARRLNRSLGDATGLRQTGVHLIEIPPGALSTEKHRHYFEEECVYILEGKGVLLLGAEEFEIGPGDFMGHRAGGAAHALRNDGEGVLRCLVFGQRLDHDVADYPDRGKRLFRQKGMRWQMVEIDAVEELGGAVGAK